jgi:hypothetical protein
MFLDKRSPQASRPKGCESRYASDWAPSNQRGFGSESMSELGNLS